MNGKKLVSLGLAGCLFLGSTAFAASLSDKYILAAASEAKKSITQVQQEHMKVVTKTIEQKNELIEAEIKIPVIQGLKDKEFEIQLNSIMEQNARKQLKDIENEAKELAEKAKGSDYVTKPFVLHIDYDVKCDDENILSIAIDNFSLTGASGYNEVDYYNIDKQASKVLTLKDLFKEGIDFKAVLNKEIAKQIQARLKEEPASYFEDDEFGFKSIKDDQGFYLENGNLIIGFEKYEIAPGSTGTPEFKITFRSMENLLKNPELAKVQKQQVIVESKKIEKKNELVDGNITYPQIQGLTDKDYEEKLNSLIELEVNKELQSIEKEAEELAKRPFVLNIDYSVKCDNDDLLSIVLNKFTLTGASGFTRISDYNIDKKANRTLELKDLFEEGVDFKSIINEEIKAQIDEKLKESPTAFFTGEDGFKTVYDTQPFYIEGSDLVVVFPKYEIAPGASGLPQFRIPLEKLGLEFGTSVKPQLVIDDKLTIKVKDNKVGHFVKQVGKDKIVMVNLRDLAQNLGFKISWDEKTKTVDLVKGPHFTSLKAGVNRYFFAKVAPFALEVAPENKNGSNFVPMSFAEKVLQAKLQVIDNNTVNIVEK